MFTIEPFIGPLPIRFGMSPEDVSVLVGPPCIANADPYGNRTEGRLGYSLGYDANTRQLAEAVFSEGQLYFDGVDLFGITDAIECLRKIDKSPRTAVGVIFFLKLGVSVTLVQNGVVDKKTITVAKAGYWDEFSEDLVAYE